MTPNALTVIGRAGSTAAAGLILARYWLAAAAVFAVANLMDSLDGSLARLTGRETRLGAFLDSTFDRLGEALVIGAIGVTLAQDDEAWAVGAAFLALAASFLVSYTLVLTAFGILLAPIDGVLEAIVVVLAALSFLTVVQRLLYVRAALSRSGEG